MIAAPVAACFHAPFTPGLPTTPLCPPPHRAPRPPTPTPAAGVRKEARVQGKTVLLFWYRNQIYAIESRSPAEGAYSEGFIRAKFTQDFCIGGRALRG